MITGRSIIALAVLAALSACDANREEPDSDAPDAEVAQEPTPAPSETISILRPDIEQPPEPEAPLEPLNVTIGFPEGGTALDASALLGVQEVLASPQLALGGPIVLRGHSDAGGSDTANERASRERAERVRDWLVENDVAEDRITIIAFGEQNPIEPNALPDGSPNDEGRALNRRVEVLIVPPKEASSEAGD